MSDDDQLHRLLADAVEDIEPRDRLAEIRASVRSDPHIRQAGQPRPWLYAVAGAVASAAVIGVIAYTTDVLSGPDDPGPSFAGEGGSPKPSHSTATDPSAPQTSASTSATGTGPEAYSVYYVGPSGSGRPVLFREQHRGPVLPTSDPAGGDDILTEAVSDAMNALPADPDYTTPWRGLATLDFASYDGTGDGNTLQIALKDSAATARPPGMSAAEATAAIQQLVYTAQAAIGKREPVVFTIGRKVSGPNTLLGVDISQPIANAPVLSTLSLVNILSPTEDAAVSGRLTVSGLNNSFEGNVVVYLEQGGHKYLKQPATGGMGLHRLYPWQVTLDLSKVPPGQYHVVATNGAGTAHTKPDTDTRMIEVK